MNKRKNTINEISKGNNNVKNNKRNKYIEPICVLGLSMVLATGVLMSVHKVMAVEATTITENDGEEYYYEGRYDEAIAEYNKLQEKEKWPIYKVKAAEVHSIKGEFNESNNLLKEAIITKDKLINSEGEKYLENEKELINETIFTFFMNKEYEEAFSLGEYYLEKYSAYEPLLKTMFAVCLANDDKAGAEEIVKIYPVDTESSYDLAVLAKMEMILGQYDSGLENLKKAYALNNNEIKVFDVISEVAQYDRDNLLEELTLLSNEKSEDVAYKLFMAKVYLEDTESKSLASDIINELNGSVDNINLTLMKLSLDSKYLNESKWNDIIDELIESEDDAYIGHYLKAWTYYNNGEYEKALDSCRESIVSNREYEKNYGVLMPKIMFALGRVDNVDAYFRTSLYQEPFNYNNMISIADYYKNIVADYNKAGELYNLVLKMRPNEAEVYYDLAMLDLMHENYQGAIPNLEKAISIENDGKYYRALGAIYFNIKDNEKALENIKEAYYLDENDVLALCNAGTYYMLVEEDVWRGYANIEAAYEEMTSSLDAESRALITDNYNKAKEVYDKFVKDEVTPALMPDLQLAY